MDPAASSGLQIPITILMPSMTQIVSPGGVSTRGYRTPHAPTRYFSTVMLIHSYVHGHNWLYARTSCVYTYVLR